jgi:hypothetical protein
MSKINDGGMLGIILDLNWLVFEIDVISDVPCDVRVVEASRFTRATSQDLVRLERWPEGFMASTSHARAVLIRSLTMSDHLGSGVDDSGPSEAQP